MAGGYTLSGKNVAENRNSGTLTRVTYSKSCQLRMNVVAAMPAAAKANPVSSAEGSTPTAQGDLSRPITSITAVNANAYRAPRISAQRTCPSATSCARIGVASAASYSLAYLIRKNTLYVES